MITGCIVYELIATVVEQPTGSNITKIINPQEQKESVHHIYQSSNITKIINPQELTLSI